MDKFDIWNRALAILPHDRRVAPSNTSTTEYLRCADNWDAARRHVLSAHDWGWATRALSHAHGSACGADWRFTFARPSDALRILGLFDISGRRVKAEAVEGFFRARSPVVEMRYIPDLDDDTIDTWPAHFTEAVAWELARRIAPTIQGKPSRTATEGAARALEAARKIDASETAWNGTGGRTFAEARR